MTLNDRSRISSASPAPQQTWIDPLQKAGDELIASYQRVEEAWKKAEAKLALSHVPIDVRILVDRSDLGDPENPMGERVRYLGFFKMKNQWRICYVQEDEIPNSGPPEDDWSSVNVWPITESPVEVRLEMFDWFEPLYNKVMEVTKSYIPKIRDKVAKFETSLDLIDL